MESYQTFLDSFRENIREKNIANKGDEWRSGINPDDVLNAPDVDSDTFWSQHGESNERYKDLILNYQKAQEELEKQGSLDHLPLTDPINMAYQCFHGSDPIDLVDYNGKLMINNNGRHRIEAAKQLKAQGYDVKLTALVTKYESKNEGNKEDFYYDKVIIDNIKKVPENSNIVQSSYKSSNMGHQLENQIELLQDAKRLFAEHSEKINDLTTHFNTAVRGFEQDELNHDYMDFLEEFLADYSVKLRTLEETINDEYIPSLQRKIQYLEDRVSV